MTDHSDNVFVLPVVTKVRLPAKLEEECLGRLAFLGGNVLSVWVIEDRLEFRYSRGGLTAQVPINPQNAEKIACWLVMGAEKVKRASDGG